MTEVFPLKPTVSRLITQQATQPANISIAGVARALNTSANMTIFDGLVRDIEVFSSRNVTDMRQLKLRDDKKTKGKAWELFCKEWLLTLPSRKYSDVWLLAETPLEVLQLLQLSKVDSGIDLVCRINSVPHNASGCGFNDRSCYIAVQCKYRGTGKTGIAKSLAWSMFSSFVGLCALTGPWQFGLIMTNAPGLGRKSVPVKNRFRSLCLGTFRRTSRDQWLRIAGLTTEYRLGEKDEEDSEDEDVDDKKLKVVGPPINSKPIVLKPTPKSKQIKSLPIKNGNVLDTSSQPAKTVEEMREARLKMFEGR